MSNKILETKEMLALGAYHMEVQEFLLNASIKYRELQEKANKSICKDVPHNGMSRYSKNPARLESLSYAFGVDHLNATKYLQNKGFDMQLGSDFFKACTDNGIDTSALRGGGR